MSTNRQSAQRRRPYPPEHDGNIDNLSCPDVRRMFPELIMIYEVYDLPNLRAIIAQLRARASSHGSRVSWVNVRHCRALTRQSSIRKEAGCLDQVGHDNQAGFRECRKLCTVRSQCRSRRYPLSVPHLWGLIVGQRHYAQESRWGRTVYPDYPTDGTSDFRSSVVGYTYVAGINTWQWILLQMTNSSQRRIPRKREKNPCLGGNFRIP